MTSLVACLGAGKGTWSYLKELISKESWDSVFLITNLFGSQNFNCGKEINFVVINEEEPIAAIINSVKSQLKDKIKDTEVALNLISGGGKEHMAILSALIQLGLGIRFIALAEEGVIEV